MKVAGVDYSTRAVDIVTLDEDNHAEWHHHALSASTSALERARSVSLVVPGRDHAFWSDIDAVGMERVIPHGSIVTLLWVMGAVLTCIPGRIPVEPLTPSRWKSAVGLSGSATKEQVARFAEAWCVKHRTVGADWNQDAKDALCMALVARAMVTVD